MSRLIQTVDRLLPVAGKLGRTAWAELKNVKRALNSPTVPVSDPRSATCIAELKSSGYSALPNFISKTRCAELRDEIDRLFKDLREHVWVDEHDSDHRLYGANRVSSLIAEIFDDPFIRQTVHGYEQSDDVTGLALAARLDHRPGNRGSGSGWHRDSPLHKQTKAILYLSDVEPEHGPFEYLPGSHRPERVAYDMLRCNLEHGQLRFADDEIDRLEGTWPGYERARLTAPEGSIVFADTRGLHRGSPIKTGVRYAISMYLYFGQPIPPHVVELAVPER